jgi:hydrogenase maturation protease
MTQPRILIACIGNIFLGDDAFGVEVARRLAAIELPEGLHVVDFGIRGIDLTYALMDGYEAVILVDAAPRGEPPGTLYVLEPTVDDTIEPEGAGTLLDAHGMDPAKVLRLAASMGSRVGRLLLVGCEPVPYADPDDMQDGLSEPVRSAVIEAVPLILALAGKLLRGEEPAASGDNDNPIEEVGTWQA